MSSISLPPGRSVPPYVADQESLASSRGRPTRSSLRTDPEIVLGVEGMSGGGRKAEASPLTFADRGVREPAKPVRAEKTVLEKVRTEKKSRAEKTRAEKKWTWKFWARPGRRALELEELRRGCERLEGVMGSIRDEMVSAKSDRAQLNKTLSPLPVAVAGLQRVGETQARTNKVLGGVKECLERLMIQLTVETRRFKQSAKFGGEYETLRGATVVEGLLTHSVAGEKQLPFFEVPKSQRKHARGFDKSFFNAPGFDRGEQCLCIGMPAPFDHCILFFEAATN